MSRDFGLQFISMNHQRPLAGQFLKKKSANFTLLRNSQRSVVQVFYFYIPYNAALQKIQSVPNTYTYGNNRMVYYTHIK